MNYIGNDLPLQIYTICMHAIYMWFKLNVLICCKNANIPNHVAKTPTPYMRSHVLAFQENPRTL